MSEVLTPQDVSSSTGLELPCIAFLSGEYAGTISVLKHEVDEEGVKSVRIQCSGPKHNNYAICLTPTAVASTGCPLRILQPATYDEIIK